MATPPVGVAKVTAMVFEPVSAVTGRTVMFTAVPGPVLVLHVSAIGVDGDTVSKFTAWRALLEPSMAMENSLAAVRCDPNFL